MQPKAFSQSVTHLILHKQKGLLIHPHPPPSLQSFQFRLHRSRLWKILKPAYIESQWKIIRKVDTLEQLWKTSSTYLAN